MDNLTEEQWKEIIKRKGCVFKELYKVRGEYANTPLYLRVYISLLAKQEVFDDIEDILENYRGVYSKIDIDKFNALRKNHLSTFQKEGRNTVKK